jgi:membrane fusion protein, multidrug efflux system
VRAAAVAALTASLAGCGGKAAPAAPPSSTVTVLTVQPQTIPDQPEWVAQAAASKSVQVRAQVTGIIVDRPYVEGTDVRKGTVLYRIDPRTYEANYQSAQARLAETEAQLANADRTLNRLRPLLAERAVAQQDVDNAQAAYDQARAAVLDARAAVAEAKKSFDDTSVRAEITGRAGRALMELGALTAGPTDLLTTVDQVDPIYVLFNPSDQYVLQWRRDIAAQPVQRRAGARAGAGPAGHRRGHALQGTGRRVDGEPGRLYRGPMRALDACEEDGALDMIE